MKILFYRKMRITDFKGNVESAFLCGQFEMAQGDAHIDLLDVPAVPGCISFRRLLIEVDFVPTEDEPPRLFVYGGRCQSYSFQDIPESAGVVGLKAENPETEKNRLKSRIKDKTK